MYFYCQANVLLQAHHTCLFSQMVVWFITMEEEEGMPASSKYVSKQATPL